MSSGSSSGWHDTVGSPGPLSRSCAVPGSSLPGAANPNSQGSHGTRSGYRRSAVGLVVIALQRGPQAERQVARVLDEHPRGPATRRRVHDRELDVEGLAAAALVRAHDRVVAVRCGPEHAIRIEQLQRQAVVAVGQVEAGAQPTAAVSDVEGEVERRGTCLHHRHRPVQAAAERQVAEFRGGRRGDGHAGGQRSLGGRRRRRGHHRSPGVRSRSRRDPREADDDKGHDTDQAEQPTAMGTVSALGHRGAPVSRALMAPKSRDPA